MVSPGFRVTAALVVLTCAASASCTALIDLQEPPAGASDAATPPDSTTGGDSATTDGMMTDGATTDGTLTDAPGESTTPDGGGDGEPSDAIAPEEASDAGDAAEATVGIPVQVTGLANGASVVLQDNGGATLSVGANGGATFPFPDGGTYSIAVLTQPSSPPELCTVTNGAGTTSAPTTVDVVCGVVTSLGAGTTLTCALLSGGTVDCWGDNTHGQLGNGTNVNSNVPVQVNGIFAATAISVGQEHACAVQSGSVYCWGFNSSGQLGNGSTNSSSAPATVTGLGGAVAVAAGLSHTCALLQSGVVECWGDNVSGDLGNGSTSLSTLPVTVSAVTGDGGLSGAVGIAAGQYHSCAVLSSGAVTCWGQGTNGQLGNGSLTTSSSTPLVVPGVSGATQVSAGVNHTCAVLGGPGAEAGSPGSVSCWGNNTNGELGNNQTSDIQPTLVSLSKPATEVGCGDRFTCARLLDGTVDCWGGNNYGELGNAALAAEQSTPEPVAGVAGATQVVTGLTSACALSPAGVQCWGSDDWGELGSGAATTYLPTSLTVAGTITALVTGSNSMHACVVVDGGATEGGSAEGGGPLDAGADGSAGLRLECWGDDDNSELGNGTELIGVSPAFVPGLSGVTGAAVGGDHTCAILAGGTVECLGNDSAGQVGNGTIGGAVLTPVTATGVTGAVALAAGQNFTCALVSDGGVDCWGQGLYGQLGNGVVGPNVPTPGPVAGLTAATGIAAGENHACAVLVGGQVDCWGWNSEGQLGVALDGGASTTATATTVPGLTGAVAVTAGTLHTCALLSDGGVDCWGINNYGQIGNGTIQNVDAPTPVTGLTGALAIAAGPTHTCARVSGGALQCWGSNAYGQLGAAVPLGGQALTPVVVPGVSGVTAVGGGTNMTCALTTGSALQCWGWNAYSQLGIGIVSQSPTPVGVE
jgi:alpha-tubulin suppressor-like RCC1 family protein